MISMLVAVLAMMFPAMSLSSSLLVMPWLRPLTMMRLTLRVRLVLVTVDYGLLRMRIGAYLLLLSLRVVVSVLSRWWVLHLVLW